MLPPSVNHIYGRGRGGRTFKNAEAEAFTDVAFYELLANRPMETYTTFCKVDLTFTFKNKASFRRSDTDNLLKLVFDALQDAKYVKNDNLIIEVSARRVLGTADSVSGILQSYDQDLSPSAESIDRPKVRRKQGVLQP